MNATAVACWVSEWTCVRNCMWKKNESGSIYLIIKGGKAGKRKYNKGKVKATWCCWCFLFYSSGWWWGALNVWQQHLPTTKIYKLTLHTSGHKAYEWVNVKHQLWKGKLVRWEKSMIMIIISYYEPPFLVIYVYLHLSYM